MAVTLKNIADEVGLNISTVSRVLTQPDSSVASNATRRRVVEAARRLGYRPNAAARALASGRSGCVGILVPELQDPVFGHYIEQICDLLAEHGLLGLPLRTGWSPERQLRPLELLGTRQIDAAICLYYHAEHREVYERLRQQGETLVFRVVDEPVEGLGLDCVGIDVSDAYESLFLHMVKRGYRRVAVLGGFAAEALANRREDNCGAQSMLAVHRKLGMEFAPELAIPCGPTAAEAYEAIRMRLEKEGNDLFDGVVVQTGKLLPGVWRALMDQGLAVPEQVGVASITDSELCRFAPVPITVWDQPIEKICRGLVRLLLSRRANPEGPVTTSSYASRLVVRESTAGKKSADSQKATK